MIRKTFVVFFKDVKNFFKIKNKKTLFENISKTSGSILDFFLYLVTMKLAILEKLRRDRKKTMSNSDWGFVWCAKKSFFLNRARTTKYLDVQLISANSKIYFHKIAYKSVRFQRNVISVTRFESLFHPLQKETHQKFYFINRLLGKNSQGIPLLPMDVASIPLPNPG